MTKDEQRSRGDHKAKAERAQVGDRVVLPDGGHGTVHYIGRARVVVKRDNGRTEYVRKNTPKVGS